MASPQSCVENQIWYSTLRVSCSCCETMWFFCDRQKTKLLYLLVGWIDRVRLCFWICTKVASTAQNISNVLYCTVLYEEKCHNQLCWYAAPFCHRIHGARVLTRSRQVTKSMLSVFPCTASKISQRGNWRVFSPAQRVMHPSHWLELVCKSRYLSDYAEFSVVCTVLYCILSSAISPFLSRDPQQHTSEKCNGLAVPRNRCILIWIKPHTWPEPMMRFLAPF
jgi:hypothetical protein